ncbi:unnamed protein product [Trichobilharzia szidati]|nr:unnamed protein product [Trichobilharzia szidati]
MNSTEVSEERKPLQPYGSGSYVAICIERGSKMCYAAKVMQKKVISIERKRNIGQLLKLDHKNLVRLKEVFETPNSLYLVIELADGGELFQRLTKFPVYNEKTILVYFRQMINGIKYLHEYGIIHRNLKPENILLSSRENDAIVKITDYSPQLFTTEDLDMELVCFMTTFCPPELLLSRRYDKAVDLWALGILLYIMLTGNDPYQSKTGSDLYHAILHCDIDYKSDPWKLISLNAQDAVKRLLVTDPQFRIITPNLLKHSWLNGIDEHEQHLHSVQKNLEQFNKQRTERLNGLSIESGIEEDWLTDEYVKLPRRSSVPAEDKENLPGVEIDKDNEDSQLMEDGVANGRQTDRDDVDIDENEQDTLNDLTHGQLVGNSFKNLLEEYTSLVHEQNEQEEEEDTNQEEVNNDKTDDAGDVSIEENEPVSLQEDAASDNNDDSELVEADVAEDFLELENAEN